MGLEFETAAVRTAEEDEIDEGQLLTLNGEELRYYRPGDGQIALVMAMTERRQADQKKVAGLIDFFFSIFDEDSQKHLQARLWDRRDPFDINTKGGINDILDSLFEEWAGRPTKRSIASTESRETTGHSSSQVIQGSTSSDSPATNF